MLDCLEDSPGETVAAGDLYEIYTNWCQDKGYQYPCGINIFGSRLQERGVQKKRKNTGVVYLDKILKDNKYTVSDF
jgi:phage/plasmid-associated DNA primase